MSSHFTPVIAAALCLLGFGVGVFGTLVGAGGGFILTPVLLLLYPGSAPALITAISLVVVFFNAGSGSVAYARQRRIDYRSGVIFALCTLPGSVLGVLLANQVSRPLFDAIMGVVLGALAVWLLVSPQQAERGRLGAWNVESDRGQRRQSLVVSGAGWPRGAPQRRGRVALELPGDRQRRPARAVAGDGRRLPNPRRDCNLALRPGVHGARRLADAFIHRDLSPRNRAAARSSAVGRCHRRSATRSDALAQSQRQADPATACGRAARAGSATRPVRGPLTLKGASEGADMRCTVSANSEPSRL